MNSDYLRTENLAVGYDGRRVAEGVNISLKRGEILAVIGPNGSGKSTILKSISGQLQPICGKIYIDGVPADSMNGTAIAKKMAVMLTERPRTEWMTCGDVASAGRYPHTGKFGLLRGKDKEKVYEALKMTGMQDYYDMDFMNLSDGQKQRVLLARAVCQEPEILVLDEPVSYLDIRHKMEILNILRYLARQKNVAIILSIHEIDLAQKIADTVLCVKNGRADRCGSPREIFRREYIRELYELDNGDYSEIFGSVEWKPQILRREADFVERGTNDTIAGEGRKNVVDCDSAREEEPENFPKVFVIAGGGSGAPVFRLLQRKSIPFAVGVLQKNDTDYELARMIANRVISEKAFCGISRSAYDEALSVIRKCEKVICCLRDDQFCEMNAKNKDLLDEARSLGVSVESANDFMSRADCDLF